MDKGNRGERKEKMKKYRGWGLTREERMANEMWKAAKTVKYIYMCMYTCVKAPSH